MLERQPVRDITLFRVHAMWKNDGYQNNTHYTAAFAAVVEAEHTYKRTLRYGFNRYSGLFESPKGMSNYKNALKVAELLKGVGFERVWIQERREHITNLMLE